MTGRMILLLGALTVVLIIPGGQARKVISEGFRGPPFHPGYPPHPWYPHHGYPRHGYPPYPVFPGPYYPPFYYGYHPAPGPHPDMPGNSDESDTPDKEPETIEDNQASVRYLQEVGASLEARLSVENKNLGHFLIEDRPALFKKIQIQDALLDNMEAQLAAISEQLSQLEIMVSEMEDNNHVSLTSQEESEIVMASQKHVDIRQSGKIAGLVHNTQDMEHKLSSVMDNSLQDARKQLASLEDIHRNIQDKENRKMCEVGKVTLSSNDPKAEYLFESTFQEVPMVLHSLCGFVFDTNVGGESNSFGGDGSFGEYRGGGENGGGAEKPPSSIGALSTGSVVSKTGVTFEVVSTAFGSTALASVNLCFQACSLGRDNL